ncbi:DUF6551 family protein [Ochrobactrum sp. CGA5]|uniref:DUF6551 family protein n=1 Tax=Ochrobactrum sp. CGA5 TaxID=2583453 RepID=UPI001120ED2F|nr:DUF6551 family protein [Ochrobactrum sp. CGA5]
MSTLRPIYAFSLSGIEPNTPPTGQPIFENVDPSSLFVDGAYQRDVGERGVRQIRRMIEHWDWSKYQPPVCTYAENDEGKTILKILDGQHTAIAAASHPRIDTIPVMIVEASGLEAQAKAFIGQNTDRLQVTKLQLHQAALIAGDEDALDIQKVCDRAGVRLLLANNGKYEAGDTVAISAVSAVVKKYTAINARKILEVLAKAELAPISTPHIRAAEHLMTAPDYADSFEPEDLTAAIVALGPKADAEAKLLAISHKIPHWKALAVTWFKNTKKRRKVA